MNRSDHNLEYGIHKEKIGNETLKSKNYKEIYNQAISIKFVT